MSCTAPTITIAGITISTNDFENAKKLLEVSGDNGDPLHDGYDESVASGNNTLGIKGAQTTTGVQSSLPGPITEKSKSSDDALGNNKKGVPVDCQVWDGDYEQQLSPNFKVKDFTVGALYPNELIDAAGYSKSQRCCNLQALALNVAEPMRAKFGQFRINSGIRNKNSTPNGVSQHVLGEALDIQFVGWNYSKYWENAAWVRDNIAYDQFIFEHSDKTGLAWYHLSFKRSGNRSPDAPTKVMTMYRNKYSQGLHRYG